MPKKLTDAQAAALGAATNHERMDNGETRFRLCFADGASFIRTEASEASGWQNSHYHRAVIELNVVQAGAVLYVELRPDGLHTRICRAGDCFRSDIGARHNGYFAPGTVVLTVKYGDQIAPGDWYAAPELDALCRGLDPAGLLASEG